jgi:hypothetical protein
MIDSAAMAVTRPLTARERRAIMPLPRRSLRERLPPDVAASIEYPPAAAARVFPYLPNTPPRSSSSGGSGGEEGTRKIFPGAGKLDGQPRHANARGQQPGPLSAAQAESVQSRAASSANTTARLPTPQPSVSTASSTDGQDVLECNNKKKRKIPTASDATLHNGLGENASSGPTNVITPVASIHSNATTSDTSMAGYAGPGAYANMGMSGSGRGTLGIPRSRALRNPLRDIQSGNAAWGFRTGGRLASGQPSELIHPPLSFTAGTLCHLLQNCGSATKKPCINPCFLRW